MGCYLLYTKNTKLCVDHLTEKDGAEQAHEIVVGLVYVLKEIPIVESAVEAV